VKEVKVFSKHVPRANGMSVCPSFGFLNATKQWALTFYQHKQTKMFNKKCCFLYLLILLATKAWAAS